MRRLRTAQGISQEELGHRSRLHRNYVGAAERGEINLSLAVILKLANALDVKLAELFAHAEL